MIEFIDQVPGAIAQQLAVSGQLQSPPDPFEQVDTQFLLQQPDMPADRGLRDAQAARGQRDVLELGGDDEAAQLPEIHFDQSIF
jgi:hypothetical protein